MTGSTDITAGQPGEVERRSVSQSELMKFVQNHRKWLNTSGKNVGRADLSNCDLRGLDFQDADLRNAVLRNADFTGSDLQDSALTGADLSRAQLSASKLRNADLRRSDLTGVNLRDAQLCGAKLYGATLREVDLTTVHGLVESQLAGTDLSYAELPGSIGRFSSLEQISDIAIQARNLLWVTIGACLFAGITASITTDGAALAYSASTLLPVVQMNVPIIMFFWIMPIILLGLYAYLHSHLQYLWKGLAGLPAIFPDGVGLDDKAYPLFLVGLVRLHVPVLKRYRPPLWWLQAYASLGCVWVLVPFTLFVAWVRYVRMHDFLTTLWQIVALVAATWMGMSSYMLAVQTLRGECGEGLCVDEGPKLHDASAVRSTMLGLAVLSVFCLLLSAIAMVCPGWMPLALRSWTCANLSYAEVSRKPDDWNRLTSENRDALLGVKGALLEGANLRGAKGVGAFLADATLTKADLQGANFCGADLRKSALNEAQLQSATLSYANLQRAGLGGAKLQGANLRNAMLDGANLWRADLSGANLYGAALREATLQEAKMRDAVLAGADLTKTILRGARLRDTDFGGAKFNETDLQGADLSLAKNLTKEQIEAACCDEATKLPAPLEKFKKITHKVSATKDNKSRKSGEQE